MNSQAVNYCVCREKNPKNGKAGNFQPDSKDPIKKKVFSITC